MTKKETKEEKKESKVKEEKKEVKQEKKEVSKKYTVSIAYNKGAYQVIPTSDIKDIGK